MSLESVSVKGSKAEGINWAAMQYGQSAQLTPFGNSAAGIVVIVVLSWGMG
jgi:hypothetical protein